MLISFRVGELQKRLRSASRDLPRRRKQQLPWHQIATPRPGQSSIRVNARAYSTGSSDDGEFDSGAAPTTHKTVSGEKESNGNDARNTPERDGASHATTVESSESQKLTHLTSTGEAHMVSVAGKAITSRLAVATSLICFSHGGVLPLIQSNNMKKGDVLGTARIAGIMAAKRTPDLVPLCHPISITNVNVDLSIVEPSTGVRYGGVAIRAKVACDGKTGVEMEALTAATIAGLTVYDMCKAVDKSMSIKDTKVIEKRGGKSGDWVWDQGKEG